MPETCCSVSMSLEASYGQNTEQLDLARANEAFAKREFDRASALAKQKLASDFALDQAQHSLDVARQQVRVTEQQIAQIRAKLGGDPHGPISRQARYLEAKAALESAKLDLRHANVLAPFAGVASKVPLPGQYVTAGNAVMSVVADTGVWIEANYKETELTNVRPHQPVSIELDTYPGRSWGGEVQSISQATGAEFAIIPPQNATGNWVKVIQRIPVRIAVHNEAGDPPLRAGMSASVSIDTGHRRTWSSLIHALTPFSSTRGGTDGSSPGARE
jgi:membrane fusion protein (multidrug efflux system)